MRQIDTEDKGFITKRDWLQFLSVEPSGNEESELSVKLKRSFDLIDVDGSGTISVAEMENIIKSQFLENIKEGHLVNREIEGLIVGIARDLVGNAGNKDLNWINFKKYFPNIDEKLKTAKHLIKEYF